MASRPVWTGQIRLSLVSIPVEIHAATRSGARVSFRQIHGPSGKPVSYTKSVAGLGPVKTDDILKGFDTGEGEFLLIDPDEVEAIRLETKKTLDLVQFVNAAEISPLWYDRPYYVVPADRLAEDAYRVVRDALRKAGRVGLGQLTMRGREYLCAIRPCGDGLLLETLFYADEIKEAEPLFSAIEDAEADPDLLAVAGDLIDRKTAPFDAAVFRDHYDLALRDLIDTKRKNRRTPRAPSGAAPAAKATENVIDLMDALRRSLASAPKARGTPPPKAKPGPPSPKKRPAKKAG